MKSGSDLVNHAVASFEATMENLTGDEFVTGLKMMDRTDRDRLLKNLGLRSPKKHTQIAGTARQARMTLRGLSEDARRTWLFLFAVGVAQHHARRGLDSEDLVAALDDPDSAPLDRAVGYLMGVDAAIRDAVDQVAGQARDRRGPVPGDVDDRHGPGDDTDDEPHHRREEPFDTAEPDDTDGGSNSRWRGSFGTFTGSTQALAAWMLGVDVTVSSGDVLDSYVCEPHEQAVLRGVSTAAEGGVPRDVSDDDWALFGWLAARTVTVDEPVDVAAEEVSVQTLGRVALLEDAALAGPVVKMLWRSHPEVAARIVKDLPPSSPSAYAVLGFLLDESHHLERSKSGLRAARLAEHLLDRLDSDDDVVRAARNLVLLNEVTLFRSRSQFLQAQERLDRVDRSSTDPNQARRALVEEVLVGARVAMLDEVRLPSGPGDDDPDGMNRFRPFVEQIEQIEQLSQDPEIDTGSGRSLLPFVIRGAFAEIDGDDLVAADRYLTALDVIADGSMLGPGLHFQRGLCLLRLLDPSLLGTARNALDAAVNSGFRPSKEQWQAVHDLLSMLGSDYRHEWLDRAVASGFDWAGYVPTLTEETAAGNTEARRTAVHLAGNVRIPSVTRFELLVAALRGSFVSGSAAEIDQIVDLIEDLLAAAASRELDRQWGQMLSDDASRLREEIGPVAADLTGVQLLRRSGRVDEATELAERVFWRVQGSPSAEFSANDVIGLITEMGCDEPTLDRLRRACAAEQPEPQDVELAAPVTVVFVGGNETQATYDDAVNRFVQETWGDKVAICWEHPGWGTNWGPVADRVEAMYPQTDALVLMTFVRTNLGRRLRRTAGEAGVPWVACTGHGKGSVAAAVTRAVQVAARQRAADDPDR